MSEEIVVDISSWSSRGAKIDPKLNTWANFAKYRGLLLEARFPLDDGIRSH